MHYTWHVLGIEAGLELKNKEFIQINKEINRGLVQEKRAGQSRRAQAALGEVADGRVGGRLPQLHALVFTHAIYARARVT